MLKVIGIRYSRKPPTKSYGYLSPPTWIKKWEKRKIRWAGGTRTEHVRRAECGLIEIRWTPPDPKSPWPRPPVGPWTQADCERRYFPRAELWRMYSNGSTELLVRLAGRTCPETREKAFDALTQIAQKPLAVWDERDRGGVARVAAMARRRKP